MAQSVGKIFVELDLDASRYTRAQKTLLRDATSTTLNIEDNFRKLGIKSSAEYDLMRQKIVNANQAILASAKATANDRLRAEQSMNAQLQRINEQQFGKQVSTINALKSHWIAASVAIGAAMVAASKAWDLLKQGADFAEQQGILNNLGRKYNETADSIVASMQRASDGLIARADLMQVALAGIAKGLNPEQLTNLADAAKILGDAVGKDATTALQDLTTALETGRTKGLKNYLGTAIDLEKVFGDLYSKLTEAEKAQALYSITMIEATKLQSAQTGAVSETADEIERLEADFKNVKLTMATFFMEFTVRAYNSLNIMAKSRAAWGAVTGILDRPMGPEITVPQPGQGIANYEAQLANLRAQLRNRKSTAGGGGGAKTAASNAYLESTRDLLAPFQADADFSGAFAGSVKATEEATKKAEEYYSNVAKWSQDTTQKTIADAKKQESVTADVWDKMGYYHALTGKKTTETNSEMLDQMIRDYEETFVGGWKAGLVKIEQYQTTWGDGMQNMMLQSYREMSQSFSDILYDGITGDLKRLDKYAESMFKSILRHFTDTMGEMAAKKIILWFKADWVAGGKNVLDIVSSVLKIGSTALSALTSGGGTGTVPVDYTPTPGTTVAWKGGKIGFDGGGWVPGAAPYSGDHPGNDIINAWLSPGEFVVPRSVTQSIASQGKSGDTMLAHINQEEAALLKAMGGAGTINERTGLPQFFSLKKFIGRSLKDSLALPWLGAKKNLDYLKNGDFWDWINAVADPTGTVNASFASIGERYGEILPPWVMELGPVIGGIIGSAWGPGGAAAGAGAGAHIAGYTSHNAFRAAGMAATMEWILGNFNMGGEAAFAKSGTASLMKRSAIAFAEKWVINELLGRILGDPASGHLQMSYEGSNAGPILSRLSGQLDGMTSGVHSISARSGMYYVPKDNYPIRAHEGEAVLNRTEADAWRSGSGGAGIQIIINGNVVDHDKFARELVPAIAKAVKAGVH